MRSVDVTRFEGEGGLVTVYLDADDRDLQNMRLAIDLPERGVSLDDILALRSAVNEIVRELVGERVERTFRPPPLPRARSNGAAF